VSAALIFEVLLFFFLDSQSRGPLEYIQKGERVFGVFAWFFCVSFFLFFFFSYLVRVFDSIFASLGPFMSDHEVSRMVQDFFLVCSVASPQAVFMRLEFTCRPPAFLTSLLSLP